MVDIVRYIGLRVVSLSQPIHNIGNKLKVGLGEILKRDKAWIVERPQHFAEVAALPVAHLNINLNFSN